MNDHEMQKEFEQNVREIAVRLFPSAIGGGSEIVDSCERDGIFITEDTIHIIEATVSRSKEKASNDGKKINKLIGSLQKKHPEKAVKGWFITKDEPTADQRSAIHKLNSAISALSFNRFQSKLIGSTTNPVGN